MTTLFTSLLPTTHWIVHPSDKLPSNVLTLTEILNEQGYLTSGFVANSELAPPSHFARGFSTYQFSEPDFPLYESTIRIQFYLDQHSTIDVISLRLLLSTPTLF